MFSVFKRSSIEANIKIATVSSSTKILTKRIANAKSAEPEPEPDPVHNSQIGISIIPSNEIHGAMLYAACKEKSDSGI